MENDSVRTTADSTLVDLWIGGRMRTVNVTRQAIEAFLGLALDGKAALSEADRQEFVRTHLGLVMQAATAQVAAHPDLTSVVVEAGQLGARASSGGHERRTGDRRKGDRRKLDLGPPTGIERRRR
jgi:hypothetical protein